MKHFPCVAALLLSFCLSFLFIESFAQAKANTLPQGSYKNIMDMLRDVPGLDVRSSSDKTGGSILIRGTGSLTNQKPPLFVVDGSIFNGSISNINPQDVEGISVLKDAASATAYGAQGSGGVILITTKKGGSVTNQASVNSHTESAYTYFIAHKTPLKIIGFNEEIITEGIIQQQRDSILVFIKRKTEILVPIKNIKRVEMVRE